MTNLSNPIIRIHDISNNKIIDREMNDEEFTKYQFDQTVQHTENVALLEKAAKRTELLNRLSLTEEEAKLLLG